MDELGFNKLFAGVLLAGLVLMAGVKFADVLVPHTELAENAYVINVPETTMWLASPLLRWFQNQFWLYLPMLTRGW